MPEDLRLADVDPDAVSRVATKVALTGVRLLWVNATTNVDPELLPDDWSSGARIGWDSRLQEASDETGRFLVSASFVAEYNRGWAESGTPEFDPDSETTADVEIACSFELNYNTKSEEPPEQSDLRHFAALNGTFNAWPYWREFAQSMSLRMGIPPLVVKVFVFPGFAASGPPPEEGKPSEST